MYLTAISSYDRHNFPDNSSAGFSNILAEPIILDSGCQYSIALAEISFSPNHVFESDTLIFTVFDWLYYNKAEGTYGTYIDLKLNHAIINSSSDLCNELNLLLWASIPRFNDSIHKFFTYESNRKIWFNFNPNMYITVILKADLLIMIGITKRDKHADFAVIGRTKLKDTYVYKGETRKFKSKKKLRSSCQYRDYALYSPKLGLTDVILLYSNLVKDSYIASYKANVLKFVPVPKNRDIQLENARIVVSYGSNRVYKPLVARDIHELSFKLKTLNNEDVKFRGYIRILVHIQKA